VKRLSKKQLVDLGYFAAISLIWLAIGWFLRGWFISDEFAMLQNIRAIVERDFPGDVPELETMSFAAAKAMLETLDDPYAILIPPPASHKFDADFAGEAGNTGLVPNFIDGRLTVEFVLADSPAEGADVRVGDILLAVDDVPVTPATSLTEVSLLLRGPVGTQAKLVVQRGDNQLTLTPVRQERVAVEWDILENDIGYIAQHTFTTNAPAKFEEALTAVLATNPSAIIWDLRNNGGGSLLATQEILSFFIDDGLLFKALLKDGEEELFTATGDAIAADIPLLVLVNENTISAAEISAAVIQERGRGITIGAQTFGKGTIQNMAPVGNGHLLEYTIGSWVTANGASYQSVGLSPHVQAPDDLSTAVDETMMMALDQLK
jgi:carboxyl-terminal processing protease